MTKDLSLFEFGSGNSTNFYASLVKDVISVNTDEQWYAHVNTMLPQNVRLVFFDTNSGEPYCEFARHQGKKFDAIVVDANERVACLMQAPASLTDKGVIILDDSHPKEHAEAIDFLIGPGFRKLDFEGLKPGSIRAYRTTVFYRTDNCLGI